MIVAFSTSSPWASVAGISSDGEVLWEGQEHAPRNAGAACLRLLDGRDLSEATLFVSDIGPGSFTGVRVGVTLAKMFGFLYGRPVAGVDAFDLISTQEVVVLPSKRGEFFVRVPGEPPIRSVDVPPSIGYGEGLIEQVPPNASNTALLIDRLNPVAAEAFVPEYLIPPSISQPKKPYLRSEQ